MHGSLATRLRVLRAERGLTVRQVADLSGVAKETISQVERGERHPYDRTLAKLAAAYGVPVKELLEEPVPLAEAAATSPKTEATRTQRPSSPAQGSETEGGESSAKNVLAEFLTPDYGAAREGLGRYIDRWERRLAEGELDLDAIEGFFEEFDSLEFVLDAAVYAE